MSRASDAPRKAPGADGDPSSGPAGEPPLRVLHVDSAREWRGGQNQARLLARELGDVPTVEQGLLARGGSRLAREGRALGLETVGVPWGPGLDPRAVAAIARRARGWDLLHAHSSHALQAAVLALAASGAPAGLVAARRLDYPLSSPAVWRRADLILAVSTPVARVLEGCGLAPARIRVVHDGIDPDELRPAEPGRLRSAAGAGADRVLVGSAGALVGHKDHRTLVRAAARVAEGRPDVRFLVAGEGPLRPELEAEVRERGLADRFALPGHVDDVARSLGDLDLFVMSSREEGLGTAALEAMAAGVPTVVTRAGGLADVAGDLLPAVPPEDPAALAAEIGRLLDDPEARGELGRAGRRRVEERFTARRMAESTLAAYRTVAAARRRRREHERARERLGRLRRARPPGGRGAG